MYIGRGTSNYTLIFTNQDSLEWFLIAQTHLIDEGKLTYHPQMLKNSCKETSWNIYIAYV